MPMYTFMFAIPAQMVSEEIVQIPQETLEITQDEKTHQIFRNSAEPLPILRCDECGALVVGNTYNQTLHNSFHDFLQWGRGS